MQKHKGYRKQYLQCFLFFIYKSIMPFFKSLPSLLRRTFQPRASLVQVLGNQGLCIFGGKIQCDPDNPTNSYDFWIHQPGMQFLQGLPAYTYNGELMRIFDTMKFGQPFHITEGGDGDGLSTEVVEIDRNFKHLAIYSLEQIQEHTRDL